MTAIVKEEMAMETNYLQMYQEHISGYKQYKMEKAELVTQTPVAGHLQKPNLPEPESIQL